MNKLFSDNHLPGFEAEPEEELRGVIERVVFHNEGNGYTVFKFKADGRPEPVSVVGHVSDPQPGASLRLRGRWDNNPRWGMQFKLESFDQEMPTTLEGISQYLSSGLIKGMGPIIAERIVQKFGKQTFEMLDHEIERLLEVQGIGQKNFDRIREAWRTQRGIRDLMLFL